MSDYSILKASTGSFLLAILEGIKPAIIVKIVLITIKINAPHIGKTDKLFISVTFLIIKLIGIFNKIVTTIQQLIQQ